MKYKPYPQYKDSGIEWIGSVPEGWEVKRLKYTAPAINEKIDASQSEYKFIGMEHIESWTGRRLNIDADSTSDGQCSSFKSGDVLFGKLRPYLAKALKVDEVGVCTGELLVLRPNEADQAFLFYQVLNRDFITLVDGSTYGTKMPRASWEFIGSIYQPLPSLPEQRTIASFLDRETGRIDELIGKKERQIELLQEKRQALISQAVTKGLDPNTKMKDSGIEWLGMVPEGWEVMPLRWLFSFEKGKDAQRLTKEFVGENAGEYPVYSGQTEDEGILGLYKEFAYDLDSAIFVSTVGAKAMTTRLIGGRFSLSQNCAILVPRANNIATRYFEHQLAHLFRHERMLLSSIMQPSLRFEDLNKYRVVIPGFEEQQGISDFLDRETGRIDELAEKIRSSIEKLREYRTALISAAVTGKIDVRGEV